MYAILWVLMFLLPIFYMPPDEPARWRGTMGVWISTLSFLAIFLVNNSWLVPRFLFAGRRTQYFVFSIAIILVIVALGMLAEWLHADHFRPGPGDPVLGSPPHKPPFSPLLADFVNNFIIGVLVIGFNTAVKVSAKWFRDEQAMKELEKEHLQSKLAFLQYQISPHFFMNTLNNIHAMIDYDKAKSQEAIIRLSKMMRYLLYESEHANTTLSKEIDFLNNYIELMRLRISNKVAIRFHFPDRVPNIPLPPLIFISLIENAFKHGISYQEYSFVEIALRYEDSRILFKVRNSRHEVVAEDTRASGIGLANIRNRLDLLFPGRYELTLEKKEKEFEVYLNLTVHED